MYSQRPRNLAVTVRLPHPGQPLATSSRNASSTSSGARGGGRLRLLTPRRPRRAPSPGHRPSAHPARPRAGTSPPVAWPPARSPPGRRPPPCSRPGPPPRPVSRVEPLPVPVHPELLPRFLELLRPPDLVNLPPDLSLPRPLRRELLGVKQGLPPMIAERASLTLQLGRRHPVVRPHPRRPQPPLVDIDRSRGEPCPHDFSAPCDGRRPLRLLS